MDLAERINAIVKYSGLSIRALSTKVGVKTPQTLYEILKGNTKTLSASVQYGILNAFPEINRAWLLSGDGEMFSDAETPRDEDKRIPFYDAETTGGYEGAVSASTIAASLRGYIHAGDWFDGRETAAIRHTGDSMLEYPDGCVLAVREVQDFRLLVPGKNYVIETTEYRITKRVQRGSSPDTITLYSTNQERYADGRLVYEPFEVLLSDVRRIFSVIGYIVNQSGEAKIIKQ